MLRSVDKENLLKSQGHIKYTTSTKLNPLQKTAQNEQQVSKQVPPFGQLSVQQINFEVVQKQLKKISEVCEAERKQKWAINQTKNKLQNQLKVIQIQKQNQTEENRKIRSELNQMIGKMKDLQNKANTQLTQYYQIKNQNTSAQFQIKRLRQLENKNRQKISNLNVENSNLQLQVTGLFSQIAQWKNQCKVRDAQIDLLRHNILELQNQKKRLAETEQTRNTVTNLKFEQICRQLQNWKTAFQKKQQELQTKTTILQQQNIMMKKTLQSLSEDITKTTTKSTLQKSLSLSTEQQSKTDAYHIRLFIKQNHIQKLKNTIQTLEQKIESLLLENALLTKKCTQGTIFSPSGYQRYNEIQTTLLKNNTIKKQIRDLESELQTKQKQIEHLSQKLNQTNSQIQSLSIQCCKYQATIQTQRITHNNTISQLNSIKNKLEREKQMMKTKIQGLQKDCQEKDKIIMNYVYKQQKM